MDLQQIVNVSRLSCKKLHMQDSFRTPFCESECYLNVSRLQLIIN